MTDERTPVWLARYLGMEQSAVALRSHQPHVIDGLLQSPEYAAAIARSVGVEETPESYVRRNVEQRAWRQQRVTHGDITLHVVHHETCLRLQMADPATMAAQMDRLLETAELPSVTIQIVPYSVGQYEALRIGGITIMAHPWIIGASVFVQLPQRLMMLEDTDDVDNAVAAFDQASGLALSPAESLGLIAEAAQRWRGESE
jgi:hypothetical protein